MADAKKPAPPPAGPSTLELVAVLVVFFVFLPVVLELVGAAGRSTEVTGILSSALHILKIVSTLIVMAALAVAVYAYMRIGELSAEENKRLGLLLNWTTEKTQKNVRWGKVEEYMASANPSDWKIGILEADNILDEIVERMGYEGSTLGERMKMIEASDFPYLDEAWQAHKVRNAIAHKGTDYPLSRSEAEQTINIYHRVFKELGYLS